MFLDLSLPVSDEVIIQMLSLVTLNFIGFTYLITTPQAYRKKNQKKAPNSSESPREATSSPTLTSGNDDMPGSKYQQKKAKKQAKKQAKVD